MATNKFTVLLTEDEDGFIVVECPSLPGCVSQGKNRDEAIRNISEAIELWFESAERSNITPTRSEVAEVSIPTHA